jgi:DNA-binding SARP family transcriptional activator/tetratricopeptide (TPR) repeat protein
VPGHAEYGLLGPLTVRRAGAVVPVASGKQQVVLAALLLRRGQPAGIDELAEALWGAEPPASARVTLHNYVLRLRRALGAAGESVIVTGPGGYRIDLGPDELDVGRFEAALAAGRSAARAGDWARAARVLREGLALWRGEPLAGIESPVLAAREGPRLGELRWQATEALAEAELRLGRHGEVIAGLRQLTAEQPLRERLHGLLMTALYRDGQQAAALAAYQAARAMLIDELGAEPGPELRGLHQQILNGDPVLADPGLAGPAPAGPDRLEVRYSLPPDTAAFTGREAELEAITAAVADAAAAGGVVAIRAIGGMPGVGKTALAVRAAHALAGRFPDRQLLISLHGHTPGRDPLTPEDALAGLLSATGLDPRALPPDLPGRAALWRDRTAGQRAILVLDNAASSAQVAPLLPGGTGCLVLVTSRRHLGDLPGTVVPVLLDTLEPGPAAAMFRRLAPRAADGPEEQVAELTALAGYLPLAISLLARVYARHPSWTLADLAAETRARMLTLTAENDSVAAALEVSCRHLPPARQQFFRALGLHPGTTTDAYAAAALAGIPAGEAAAHLDALHGEGLLTETGYRRYGMHDLIRRYAADLTAADPAASRDQALTWLLNYYTAAARAADRRLARRVRPGQVPPAAALATGPELPGRAEALAWMRAERASLLACIGHAAAHGQPDRVIALTAAMAAFLDLEGPWPQAAALHQAAVTTARRQGDRAAEAGAVHDLGRIRCLTGDYPAAAGLLEQAIAICQDLGDRPGEAISLGALARVRYLGGDNLAAAGLLERALAISQDLGDCSGEAHARYELGRVRYLIGDYPAAAALTEQALASCQDLGDRSGQAAALHQLGLVRHVTGDYPAAADLHEQALAIYSDLSDRNGEAAALYDLGRIRSVTGDHAAAAGLQEQALAIHRALGDRLGEVAALHELGRTRYVTGDYPAAAGLQEQALAICRDLGSGLAEANVLCELGRTRHLLGDYPVAAGLLERSVALFREAGDPQGEAEALTATGALLAGSGRPREALAAYREALGLARQVGSPLDEARALEGAARCAAGGGDPAGARAGLRQAIAIYQRIGAAEAGPAAEYLAALEFGAWTSAQELIDS